MFDCFLSASVANSRCLYIKANKVDAWLLTKFDSQKHTHRHRKSSSMMGLQKEFQLMLRKKGVRADLYPSSGKTETFQSFSLTGKGKKVSW